MITLHFHLQPQYKYELFHLNFTSFHCTGRYELNKLTSLPICGFIAQLVEHRTGIRGGHGFESRWSPDFFQASSFQLHKIWKIYCDDHSSLSSTTAIQIWIISYKLHNISLHALSVLFFSIIACSVLMALVAELRRPQGPQSGAP